ncbi:Vesicular-fusion protein SEC18 [Intoshia linei]|uniref:Vesicle-fusing ATPase n=1 Tax=Intoshia linei TaxID=1819745 RepID=A0A177B9L5_9BILA|nr:Vesicular-fusion protein SEC18 [Intoshia linei]
MLKLKLRCTSCNSPLLALTNLVYVGKVRYEQLGASSNGYVYAKTRPLKSTKTFVVTMKCDGDDDSLVQLSSVQRTWMNISDGDDLEFSSLILSSKNIKEMSVNTVFVSVSQQIEKMSTHIDSTQIESYLKEILIAHHLTLGQIIVMRINKIIYKLTVVKLKNNDSVESGICTSKTRYYSHSTQQSNVTLGNVKKTEENFHSPFAVDVDFQDIGVGGLNDEFQTIFRRAFITRLFPPTIMHEMGIKHCRGILLHGPPGTGKTLLARQIGKMLNAKEPKIVNGPQILDKYVGASEENVRKLFADAEADEKKYGINSPLNMIIFDEIDAICKQRGSMSGTGGNVTDTVINQLLSKLDGVDQLNNILVIGMTNRLDMIDTALLRPGRFELHVQINLPDEGGRQEILKIHTSKLAISNKLHKNVDLEQIAKETANFSGAECAELVKSATKRAMNKHITTSKSGEIKMDKNIGDKLLVEQRDFCDSILTDVVPSFGSQDAELAKIQNIHIIRWNNEISKIIDMCKCLTNVEFHNDLKTPMIKILFEGEPASGKTSIASYLVNLSNFPFIKYISSKQMIGFSDYSKCDHILQIFEDAYKSKMSCIVLDDIESIIDYIPIGPRFSNVILQCLLVLLNYDPPESHRLLIIGTTAQYNLLKQLSLTSEFQKIIHMPLISNTMDIVFVIDAIGAFCTNSSKNEIVDLLNVVDNINIGIKKLLLAIDSAQSSPLKLVDYIMKMNNQNSCGVDS